MEKKEKNNHHKEFKGRNLEDAISLAEHILKLPRSQLNYEIVAEKTRLFGIKRKEIVIRAWPKIQTEGAPASEFLNKMLEVYPLNLKYYTKTRNELIYIIFDGEDKPLLLRKNGALLMAIQHILNKISAQKIQVDCDFFRKRKERELREYAKHIANQVFETGKSEVLELMNPYERRIVHVAINQINGLATESIGEGFLKRIKIYPLVEA